MYGKRYARFSCAKGIEWMVIIPEEIGTGLDGLILFSEKEDKENT